jgi:hypothetical protein
LLGKAVLAINITPAEKVLFGRDAVIEAKYATLSYDCSEEVQFSGVESTRSGLKQACFNNMTMKTWAVIRYPSLITAFSLWRTPFWRNGVNEGSLFWFASVLRGAVLGCFMGVEGWGI